MGVGGEDIWLLTSNPQSLISHNTKARLEKGYGLDRSGQSILIRTEAGNANAASDCPGNQMRSCKKNKNKI